MVYAMKAVPVAFEGRAMEERYQRHKAMMGNDAWRRIAETRAIIAGVGGLGSLVAMLLARIGPLHMEIWDPGIVDAPDLNRQLLYVPADVGNKKAAVAEVELGRINAEITVRAVAEPILLSSFANRHRSAAPGEHLVLFDCLDNMAGRRELEIIASEFCMPIFHGGVAQWYGQVATLLPGATRYIDFYGDMWNAAEAPAKPIMPFVVSTIASTMVGEFVHWLGSPDATPLSSRIAFFDGRQMEWQSVSTSAKE